jgi:hypothetical protein
MHIEGSKSDSSAIDPALASDKKFLLEKLPEARLAGGYVFAFGSSSLARSARRRLYYVISKMAEYERGLFDQFEFKLKGRMIVLVPKSTLSSSMATECPKEKENE